jgi:uncharacterized protein YciI
MAKSLSSIMKHFLVEITYTTSAEVRELVLPSHRAFLQTGYDKGWLLMSGPQSPKVGGIVVARAPSMEVLQAFFADDPYRLKNVATHRFVEFEPVKRQPLVEGWCNGM